MPKAFLKAPAEREPSAASSGESRVIAAEGDLVVIARVVAADS
jgi:hypothetical protein